MLRALDVLGALDEHDEPMTSLPVRVHRARTGTAHGVLATQTMRGYARRDHELRYGLGTPSSRSLTQPREACLAVRSLPQGTRRGNR